MIDFRGLMTLWTRTLFGLYLGRWGLVINGFCRFGDVCYVLECRFLLIVHLVRAL